MRKVAGLAGTVTTLLAIVSCGAAGTDQALPAFPGAEGYGALSKGGRGGRVVRVTNLNESGPGSFRHACEEVTGPRIIVFDVSGVIPGPKRAKYNLIFVKGGRVTIAGQTAPPPGIIFEGQIRCTAPRGARYRDLIIRFLRVRPNYYGKRGNGDCLRITNVDNVVLDHVSVSWGNDENVDLSGSRNVSYQWSTIEESDIQWEGGDEPHNFALIVSEDRISLHHLLFAHHHDRAPSGYARTKDIDSRNNVLYNFGTAVWCPAGNLVGNYLKRGPGAPWGYPRIYHPVGTVALPGLSWGKKGKTYVRGNYLNWAGGYYEPAGRGRTRYYPVAEQPTPVPPVTTHTAEEAYEQVLAQAGCLPRDPVSRRTIHEVRTGTGTWGRHEPPGDWRKAMAGGKAPPDADNDGMPDAWEKAHGLDANDPADANGIVPAGASAGDRHKGYTWIEFYINERADELVAEAVVNARFRKGPGEAPAKPDFEQPLKPIAELVNDVTSQDMTRKQTDTGASFYAIQNLGRMGPKAAQAVPALVKALDTEDVRKAVFVAWALGTVAPHADADRVVPALLKALERDYPVRNSKWQFNPRGFIAWALGRFGPRARDAVPMLAMLLHGQDVWARRTAAWALARIGPDAKGATQQLVKALRYSLGTLSNAQVHAVDALAAIGEPAVPELISALRSGRVEIRRGAVLALGRIGPKAKPAVPALLKLFGDKDALIRSEAALAVARIDPSGKGVPGGLVAGLDDEDYSVRHNTAGALGEAGPAAAAAVPALARALGGKRLEVRHAAFSALVRIGPEAMSVLLKALGEAEDAWARRQAARALGSMGPKGQGAVEALAKALSDADAEVRREAAFALGLIGRDAKSAADALEKARQDTDYLVRAAADAALKRIRPG